MSPTLAPIFIQHSSLFSLSHNSISPTSSLFGHDHHEPLEEPLNVSIYRSPMQCRRPIRSRYRASSVKVSLHTQSFAVIGRIANVYLEKHVKCVFIPSQSGLQSHHIFTSNSNTQATSRGQLVGAVRKMASPAPGPRSPPPSSAIVPVHLASPRISNG